jgi:hypothetical protein
MASIRCSASRLVSMYLTGMIGRNISSADIYTNGRGVLLGSIPGAVAETKASQTRKAVIPINENVYSKAKTNLRPD